MFTSCFFASRKCFKASALPRASPSGFLWGMITIFFRIDIIFLKADKKLAANTNNKSSNLQKKVKEVLNNLD